MKYAKSLMVSVIVILLLIVGVSGTMILPISDIGKEHSQAPEHSPVIDDDHNLERIDFIHYARPPGLAKPPKTPTCYKLMGLKWLKLPVTITLNPETDEDLSKNFLETAFAAASETWDEKTSKNLFSDSVGIDTTAAYGVLDGKNTIAFGDYPDDNVIAVTSVWFTRKSNQIVEFDMVFNEYWPWGAAESDGNQMDIQNIATHELGHAVGLADVYTASCNEVTMYGYSWYEEVIKRDLAAPDITGLQKIYGI